MRKSAKGRRGLKPGQHHRGQFGAAKRSGSVPPRGPDILPRKLVVATVQMAALFNEQVRDPRTGRLSRSKWAKGIKGAGLQDLVRYYARALYEGAHGDAAEAVRLASGVTKLSEIFAAHLDDKPSGQPRVTIFQVAPGEPSAEIPPEQGQRQLSKAEEGYVDLREEDVP